eukprot:g11913.t1
MVKPEATPPWSEVRAAALCLLTKANKGLTWGQFKKKCGQALDVDVLVLKKHKEPLQELVAQYTAQEDSASDEDEDEDEEDQNDEDSNRMTALRAMARAMNLGPKPFVGLKQLKKKDAETTLRTRLVEAGANFDGPFPSAREIAQARRKSETAKDLEGMDMSNIVAGSRRRRRSEDDNTSPPTKKRRSLEGSESSHPDSECSGEESSNEEDSEEEFQLSG